jgi:hypothetical protein
LNDAINDVIKRGGNTMANAAIVGGLIGATSRTEVIIKDHFALLNGLLNSN